MVEQVVYPSTQERIFISGYMGQADSLLQYVNRDDFFYLFHGSLNRVYESALHCYDIDYDISYLLGVLELLRCFVRDGIKLDQMVDSKVNQTPYLDNCPASRGDILRGCAESLGSLRDESGRMMDLVGRVLTGDNHRQAGLYRDLIDLTLRLNHFHSAARSSLESIASSEDK